MNFVSRQSFRRLLMEAVADISQHGYTSREKIERWLTLLRNAAERDLGPEGEIDDEVRRALETIYARLFDHGGIEKVVPGVARYTIQMVRPELRAELDRRIRASADLIKLNRAEAIGKTLQRFSGWATSVPPGGDTTINRRDVREKIGKPVATSRYERRRVAIDQGHKLAANVADVVAVGNGAIAAVWHSHWRRPGYQYRKDHKELDGEVFLIRDSWAAKEGLVKPAGHKYTDEIERPAALPFCSCNYVYIMSPRRLPEECLTEKGKAWVASSMQRMAA